MLEGNEVPWATDSDVGWGVDPCFLVPNVSRVCSMAHACRQQLLPMTVHAEHERWLV